MQRGADGQRDSQSDQVLTGGWSASSAVRGHHNGDV
jgi:hypothetical protein